MRLTPEQVAEEKKYLSELKERVWIGEHGLTSAEQDLFDTIEALQQENEQHIAWNEAHTKARAELKQEVERLQAQAMAMREALAKAKGALQEILDSPYRFGYVAGVLVVSIHEQKWEYANEALAAIEKALAKEGAV